MILKRLLSICLAALIAFGLCGTAFAYSDYTAVYTAEDFNNIRNNLSGEYILMNDIDLSSYEEDWEQIGSQILMLKSVFWVGCQMLLLKI